VELVQEKDDAGSSFYFKLNGVPVFMKGANYIARAIFYFSKVKDLVLPTAEVEIKIAPVPDGYELQLCSQCLAKNIYLTIGDEEGYFSDNYFDLLPGEKVTVNLDTEMSNETIRQVLAWQTL